MNDEIDGGVNAESPALAAPAESAPAVETPPATDKLPEQFSATPPHSQAAPALRQGPNPVSPAPEATTTPIPAPEPTPEIEIEAAPAAPEPPKPPESKPTPPALAETPAPESVPPPSPPQPVTDTSPDKTAVSSAANGVNIKSRLSQAFEALRFKKRAKLDKILALAAKKKSIKNDDVEKLLRVSDSTAQRYLNQLVVEGKLRRVGSPHQPTYEPV